MMKPKTKVNSLKKLNVVHEYLQDTKDLKEDDAKKSLVMNRLV